MTSQAPPNTDHPTATLSATRAPISASTQARAPQNGAAAVRRHKEQRRADSLALMRLQVADGTLVLRQMTVAEHRAASHAARQARARTAARRRAW